MDCSRVCFHSMKVLSCYAQSLAHGLATMVMLESLAVTSKL